MTEKLHPFTAAEVIRIEMVIREFNQQTGKPLCVPAPLFKRLKAFEIQGEYFAARDLKK